jgi:hypothetical protein
MQTITSAATSVNTLGKVFKAHNFEHGGINLDMGGGRFGTATEYLRGLGVRNLVWDPYNRTPEHNIRVLAEWGECVKQADIPRTITISNVLNVIKEKAARRHLLEMAAAGVVDRWTPVYIGVYEGDKSGVGRETSKGYQLNRKMAAYLPEIKKFFGYAEVRCGIIVASDSLCC